MADAIFLDILPRYDWAASEAGVRKLVGTFDTAAKQISRTFGVEAGNAARGAIDKINSDMVRMQQGVNTATTRVSEDYRKVVLAQGELERSTLRVVEVSEKYSTESSQWSAAIAKQEAATIRLTDAQRLQATSTTELATAQAGLAAKQTELAGAQSTAASKTAAVGAALNTTGLIAAGGFAISVGVATNAAADFQTTQERLVTTAGESQDQLEMVSKGLLDMAGKVGYSAQELSKGMYTVESAGYHGAEGLKVMQAASQGARAEGADLTEVTNAVTTALHDYHLPAEQAGEITSKMITAVSQGKTTFGEFAESLHSVQPLAGAAHISIDDLYASLAQMTASGMSADQATQNMANAIRSLQNPTSIMRDELAQLGLDSRDVQEHLGDRGLSGSMDLISRTILQKMGPSGKVMLDALNQSKVAADDAVKMMQTLPPEAQKVAKGVVDNTVSLGDYRKAIKDLPEPIANMLNQWRSAHDRASGFSQILKSGGNDVQTYTGALAKATGNATSMNVALMLTGENSEKTAANVSLISKATTEADGSVKGWHQTQATFNTQLAEAKASVGALVIELGNVFLPTMTNVVHWLGEGAHWLTEHKNVAVGVVIALGVIAAAWVTVKTAMFIGGVVRGFLAGMGLMQASASEGALATAARWTGAAIRVTAGWAVTAATTVAGWVATAARAAVHAAATAAAWLVQTARVTAGWVATRVAALAEFATTAAGAAASAATTAGAWLVQAGRAGAAWVGMKLAALAEFAAVAAGAALNAAATAAAWVASSVRIIATNTAQAASWVAIRVAQIAGVAAQYAMTAAQWALNAAMDANPIGAVILALTALVAGILYAYNHWQWFHDAVTKVWEWLKGFAHWLTDTLGPVFRAAVDVIKAAWTFLWDNVIKPYGELVMGELRIIGSVVTWLWQNIFSPVVHAIGDVWNWLYNSVIGPVVGEIKHDWDDLGGAWNAFHDKVFKPVADKLGAVVRGVKDFFKDMVDWGQTQWDRLKGIVSAPVKFIVNTVYDEGIVKVWNAVSGIFGGPQLPKVDFQGFAGGGVLPGYSPGRDNMLGRLPGGKVVGLSGGEGILVPELVNMLGHDTIHKANHAASGRRPGGGGGQRRRGFDGGGILSDIWGGITDAAGDLVDAATDPIGALKASVNSLLGALPGADAGTPFIDTIKGVPGHIIDVLADWFSKSPVELAKQYQGAGNHAPAAAPEQVKNWIRQAEALVGVGDDWTEPMSTLVMRESGGRIDAVNNSDSNAAKGDPSRGLAQVIGSTFNQYHRPEDGPADPNNPVSNLAAAMRYIIARYHGIGNVQQANPNMPPQGYSGGGITDDDFAGFDPASSSMDATGVGSAAMSSAAGNMLPDTAGTAASRAPNAPIDPRVTNVVDWLKNLVGWWNQKTGARLSISADRSGASGRGVEPGDRGHPNDGMLHSVNRAVDIAGSAEEMAKFANWWANDPQLVSATRQLIHDNPGFNSLHNIIGGKFTSGPQTYGSAFAEHTDHIHLGLEGAPAELTGYPRPPGLSGAGPRTLTGGGASSGGGDSSGGVTGSSILTGMGNTSNWNVKGIGEFVGAALANLALGNPVGAMLASKNEQSAGGATTAGAAYAPSSPTAAPTIDATTQSLAAYNGENAKTLKYKADIAAADERIAKAAEKLDEQHAKHPGGGTTVDQAQHNLDVANQAKATLQDRIRQAGDNAGVQASIDAERIAGQKTPSAAGQRALAGQQQTVDAASAVGLGPGGAAPSSAGSSAAAAASPGLDIDGITVGAGGGGGSVPGLGMGAPTGGGPGISKPTDTPGAGGGFGGGFGGPIAGFAAAPAAAAKAVSAAAGPQLGAASAAPNSVQPTQAYGAGQNAGSGFSTSIGSTAAGLAAAAFPGIGAAAQPAGKLLDRTIGYIGQLGGIAASGLLETFLPSGVGDTLANPSKSWFGKVALGIAGAHSEGTNRAGQSAPAVPNNEQASKQAAASAPAAQVPDQAHPGSGAQPGPGGQAPVIGGDVNINTTNGVDMDSVYRDTNRYAGAMTR